MHNSWGHCSQRTPRPLELCHCCKYESVMTMVWEARSECTALAGWQCICDAVCACVCVCVCEDLYMATVSMCVFVQSVLLCV